MADDAYFARRNYERALKSGSSSTDFYLRQYEQKTASIAAEKMAYNMRRYGTPDGSPPQASGSSGGDGGSAVTLLSLVLGILWFTAVIVGAIVTWIVHHIWNIVGFGLIVGGLFGLYHLAGYIYWTKRNAP